MPQNHLSKFELYADSAVEPFWLVPAEAEPF